MVRWFKDGGQIGGVRMKIQKIFDHGQGWWVDPEFRCPSDKSSARSQRPCLIVLHWDAAPKKTIDQNLARIKKLATNSDKKSSHFFILRDGQIWQMISVDRAAWHAGTSAWTCKNGTGSKKSVNLFSIGIDFDMVGPVTQTAAGLRDCYGGAFDGNAEIAADGKLYEVPTDEQLWVARVLIDSLRHAFSIPNCDIVGHVDVSPGRKIDPGPFITRTALGME